MCIVAVAGVAYLGAVILILSVTTSEYSPISQLASDYGVGVYGPEMNSGFFLAGVGVASLGLAVVFSARSKGQKAGGALLLLSGAALLTNSFLQTDIEGALSTPHGTAHGLAGVVFFLASPLGLLLINHGMGRRRFGVTLLAFVLGVVGVAVDGALNLNASGLAERIVILAVFASLILTAAKVYEA